MKKSLCKIFGKNLRTLRKAKGLTQLQFAEISKIQRATIGKYEIGERAPTIDHLLYFSDFFKVPTDFILGISTVDKYDVNLQSVCDFTGLTKENVELLNTLNELKKARKMLAKGDEHYIEYIDIISCLIDNLNEIPDSIFDIINASLVNENKISNLDYDVAAMLSADINERFPNLNSSDFKVLSGYNYKFFIIQKIKDHFDLIVKRIINKLSPKEYLDKNSSFNYNLDVMYDPPLSLESLAYAELQGALYQLIEYKEANEDAQHNPKEE